MNSSNPAPTPAIILTDNYKVVKAFNDLIAKDDGTSVADLASTLQEDYGNVLYLTNNSYQFISMEYQFLMNGAPTLSLELLESGGFFEVDLFRSAIANVVAELNKETIPESFKPPSTIFYVTFGLGTDVNYWSAFNAYTLVGAETFQDFGQAKKMTLTFVASLGLHEFSMETLQSFLDPRVFDRGYVKVIEKFTLQEESHIDQYPVRRSYGESIYTNARREYRQKTFKNFYKRALDNYIDKIFQVFFNTPNVLLLTPNNNIDRHVISLQRKYNVRSEISQRLGFNDPVTTVGANRANAAYISFRNKFKDNEPLTDLLTDSLPDLYDKATNFISEVESIVAEQGEALIKDPLKYTRDAVLTGLIKGLRTTENTGEDIWTFAIEDFFKLFKANLGISYEAQIGGPLATFGPKPDFNSFIDNIDNLGISLNSFSPHAKSIKEIFNSIISGYKQITSNEDIILIRETDTEILKELDIAIKRKYGKSFFNPQKPLVIFGSKQQIATYVYGENYNFDDITIEIDTTDLQKTIDNKLVKIFNLYNSQNINNTTIENLIRKDSERRKAFNDLVKKKNLPIFKYNTQNSNVISININDNKSYFNLLSQSYQVLQDYASLKSLYYEDPELLVTTLEERLAKKEAEDDSSERNEELRKKYEDLKGTAFATQLIRATPEDRLDLILKNEQRIRSNDDFLYSYLKKGSIGDVQYTLFNSKDTRERKLAVLAEKLDEEKIKQKSKAFLSYMKEEYGLIRFVEDLYAEDPLKFFIDQMDIMDKAIYQVEIETLPYFPISNSLYLFKPCLLFAMRPPIMGSNTARNPIDYVSGYYTIRGYYHKIDSNRAYSKFKLFRETGE